MDPPFPPSESPSVNGPEKAEKGTFRGTYQACSRCGVIFFGEEIEEHGCAEEEEGRGTITSQERTGFSE
jgi:hypothetical protein